MFDSSVKYRTKITIGCFIVNLGRGDKLRWVILLQNCAGRIFEIVVGVIIAKLERVDTLNY